MRSFSFSLVFLSPVQILNFLFLTESDENNLRTRIVRLSPRVANGFGDKKLTKVFILNSIIFSFLENLRQFQVDTKLILKAATRRPRILSAKLLKKCQFIDEENLTSRMAKRIFYFIL